MKNIYRLVVLLYTLAAITLSVHSQGITPVEIDKLVERTQIGRHV